MKKVEWIKLYLDLFDNEKIKQIADLPKGDTLIVIWIKLLILAGKRNDNGYIYLTPSIPFTDKMLAASLQKPLPTVRLALDTFSSFGMIELRDDCYIIVKNWKKYQNVDGLEKVRDQTRDRVAAYRDRQRNAGADSPSTSDNVTPESVTDSVTGNVTVTLHSVTGNVTCNGEVTDGNATEEEVRIESEKEKERKKQAKKETKEIEPRDGTKASYQTIIDGFTDRDDLKGIIFEFIKMRKLAKKPMTDRALTLLLNDLKKLGNTPEMQMKILDQSIVHNWLSVYALKRDYKPSNLIGANGVKLTGETQSDLDAIL